MHTATKSALEGEARKCREAAVKLMRQAESIEIVLKQAAEIAALLPTDNVTLPLPLGDADNDGAPHEPRLPFRPLPGMMTQWQACAAALEARRVPLTTAQIADTIRELGLPVNLPKDTQWLGPVMSRRKKKFYTVSKGKWALRPDSPAGDKSPA